MSVMCDIVACIHNDGNGSCEIEDVYISDAETGDPMCQDVEFEKDE